MNTKTQSFKAKMQNFARKNNLSVESTMQNYIFERFLKRLSLSEYRDNFILKGGVLISNLIGLSNRTSVDIDTSTRGIKFDEQELLKIISSICSMDLGDKITFTIYSIRKIIENSPFGGFRIKLNGLYEKIIIIPFVIDFSTCDIITPSPVKYSFKSFFNQDEEIEILGYNTETIIADKTSALIERGEENTRQKDYYDLYYFTKNNLFDDKLLKRALTRKMSNENTLDDLKNINELLERIKNSNKQIELWKKYQTKFPYARKIDFEELIKTLKFLYSRVLG